MLINPLLDRCHISTLCHVLKFAKGSTSTAIYWSGMIPTSALHTVIFVSQKDSRRRSWTLSYLCSDAGSLHNDLQILDKLKVVELRRR